MADGRGKSPGSLAALKEHGWKPGKSGNEAGRPRDESLRGARLLYETYRAKQARLEYDLASGKLIEVARAKEIYARQISEAKTAVMAIGKHARSRIPRLTPDDVATIEELSALALEGLANGAIESENER